MIKISMKKKFLYLKIKFKKISHWVKVIYKTLKNKKGINKKFGENIFTEIIY
jgi:hypothetical protein